MGVIIKLDNKPINNFSKHIIIQLEKFKHIKKTFLKQH
ncbi:hypothetical protein HPSD74_0133 [Glaesserella parasuis D74]|nr:hypothetical protein HPSD74_0133 [Glaesserella parasuis D74]